ncbi:MAG: hypothetical protein OEV28_02960 [Nitrospirota bacterium]|nr:hypothetical protein [Nitrospirota bacterium]
MRYALVVLAIFAGFLLAGDVSADVVTTKVGDINTYKNFPGVGWFKRQDGSNFPNCTQGSAYMWADLVNSTADGTKSMLSVLLTARAMDREVMVWYTVDANGYCRIDAVTLK